MSLVYQVTKMMKSLQTDARKSSQSRKAQQEKIFHGETAKGYISKCCTFAKWCQKNYGIQKLADITPEMTERYFQEKVKKGQAPHTLMTMRSALKKLEIAFQKYVHHRLRIVPKDLELPQRSLEKRQGRRAYTDKEMFAILYGAEKIGEEVHGAMQLELWFGLRKTEVLNLRVTDVHLGRKMLVVWRGKGGRLREVPIETEKEIALLKKLIKGKDEMDKLFPNLTAHQLEEAIVKACTKAGIKEHKNHNIRHTFACNEYDKRVREGKSDRQARKEVSQLLGHNRVDVVASYVPRRLGREV